MPRSPRKEYHGKLVRNATDLMLNQMDSALSPKSSYMIFDYEIPTKFVRQYYRPQTAPHHDQISDYRMEKFGGCYPFIPINQKEWSICQCCQSPLKLVFQVKDPFNPTEFVQMMVCPRFDDQECDGDDQELVPYYQFIRFNSESQHNSNIQPPEQICGDTLDCHLLIGWQMSEETLPSEVLAQHLDSKENRNQALGGNYCDQDVDDIHHFLGDEYFSTVIDRELTKLNLQCYDGFKFGGFQKRCQDYSFDDPDYLGIDNYIQIGTELLFLNYEYGNDGILHIDHKFQLKGDSY